MKKKIVIVTSGQPAANPRVVKEAKTLQQEGYIVTVIYAPLSPWGDGFDKKLFSETPNIDWVCAGYHQYKQNLKYRYARIRRKIFEKLFKIGFYNYSADFASVLFSQELTNAAKKYPADLYIAHNLGALPAAVKAAKKYSSKVAFDAEDFHRGENKEGSPHWKHVSYLENKYFHKISYLSTASPLISEEYQKLYPSLYIFTINNIFPKLLLQKEPCKKSDNILKLFWFSQVIGGNRGVEDVIEAMGILKNEKIELNLLGNLSESSREYFFKLMKDNEVALTWVNFISPVEEYRLPEIAATYDIGLALEPGRDFNNQIALSNKIFTYLLAGNAIIFSDTRAQKKFWEQNKGVGKIYSCKKSRELAHLLQFYLNNPDELHMQKLNSWKLANKKLNWEVESNILVENVNKLFNYI